MRNSVKTIGILGLWHLGLVYATSFAKLGLKITGFDTSKEIIDNLSNGYPPIFEPGLEDFLKKYLNKNLRFTKNPKEAISKKDYVFVTLDIPVNDTDDIDIRSLNKLFNYCLEHISPNTVIVISSQVPIGTCQKLQARFNRLKKKVSIIYFPENLRLGNAFKSFLEPERIILGGEKKVLKKFLDDFNLTRFPSFLMSLESAEMSKHALNAYLATCISFSSELGDICELTGANMDDVIKALKSEKRVSPHAPLNPGLGFAGGTLGRDIKTLMLVSRNVGYKPIFMKAVYKVNQTRTEYLVKRIAGILGSISGKKIGLLGLTYKPGTDTLRRSMSLQLANALKRSGAKIIAFDPMVSITIKGYEFIGIKKSLENLFEEVDIAILMTEWLEFNEKEVLGYASLMKNKILIDTKNFLDIGDYKKHDFKVYRIGSNEN